MADEDRPEKTADDHAVWLDHHMKRAEISRAMIKGAVIASVVPACQPQYCKLVDDHFGVDCFVIEGSDPSHGITIDIDSLNRQVPTELRMLPVQRPMTCLPS